MLKIFSKGHILLIITVLILQACSVSKYRYLSMDDEELVETTDTVSNSPGLYKIQTNDLIYIKFYSLMEEAVEMFNKNDDFMTRSNNQYSYNQANQQRNYEWMGYRVDTEGFIEVPVLGKIKAGGLTIEEIKQKADIKIKNYVEDAFAEVKLLSFNVEMMGAFNSPGQISTLGSRLSLMEAIDEAGGISYNGNWKRVYIIRHVDGVRYSYFLDVTNKDLLGTDKYYLMPHDVVYVEPRAMNTARINISDFTLLLSTFSSVVTAVALIISLN